MKPVLLMIATVPMSIEMLIKGQPRFLSSHYDVHIVTSGSGEDISRIEKAEGVKVHSVPMTREITPFRDLHALFSIYRIIRKLRADYVYTFTPKAGLLGMSAAFFAAVPVRLHNVVGMPLMEAEGVKRTILGMTERLSYLFATRVYSNSFGLKEYMIRNLGAGDVGVVWNGSIDGVDMDRYDGRGREKERAEIRERLGFAENDLVIVYTGRVVRDKGIEELVKAFGIISKERKGGVKLLLIGDFEAALNPVSSECREAIESDPDIVLTGFTEDIRGYLAASDIFVLPSYREGLPNSLLEAGSMGLPLLASDINGCNEVVVPGENGLLFEKKNIASLADAVRKIIGDKGLYEKLRNAVRQSIAGRYEQNRFRKEFLKELQRYADMADSSKRGVFYRNFAKPLLDRTASLILILLFSPFMLITAALVYRYVSRDIFFRQRRPGKDGKIFTVYKFRTMTDERNDKGELLPDSERLRGVGKVIRSMSLDELPQLFNVLKGDMSLIGPRPLLEEYLELYSERQKRRHEVRPGITGWAQVNGRNTLLWKDRFEYDVWYVEHLSFALDLKIAWLTALKVLKREGVSQEGHTTMEKFKGDE